MKYFVAFSFLFTLLISCREKEMTLEELKNATWSQLGKGVDYISLKNGKIASPDSIRFTVKGFLGTHITIPPDVLNEMQPELDTTLHRLILDHLPQSQRGCLRIDFYAMMSPELLTAAAYLPGDADSSAVSDGIIKLREIQGVRQVTYISKEMAKKRYLEGGNEDWDKVLESNPLPTSIEIKFDKKIIRAEDYESFKNKIIDYLPVRVTNVSISPDILKNLEGNYYILEYNR